MRLNRFRTAALALALSAGLASAQQPATTTFTYQGRLTASNAVATGSFDFVFEMYDAASGGNLVAGPVTSSAVAVSGGLFTVPVDFGNTWQGQRRWMRIQVRPAGGGAYTDLTPRQEITATPASLYSLRPWQTIFGQGYPKDGYYVNTGNTSYFGIDSAFGDLHANGGADGTFGIFSEGVASGSFNIITTAGGQQTRFTLNNGSGNVGIGTISPTARLHVVPDAGTDGVFVQAQNGTGLYGASASGAGVIGTSNGLDGVYGTTSANGHAGVAGVNTSIGNDSYGGIFTGNTYGAKGTSSAGTGLAGVSATGHGVTATGGGAGLSGAALSVANSNATGIGLVSSTNSADANLIIGQEGLGDALRVFHSYGGVVGTPLLQIQYDGSLIIDASGQYRDTPSLFFSSPRLRFGAGNSGEWIASNRIDPVDSANGLSFYTANALRGYFKNNGEFVVLDGNARKPGGGSWATTSDARVKKNITPLVGALDGLLSIHGYHFEYIDPQAVHELAGVRTGLVAQDVERVFPDWVSEDAQGVKSVSVHGFEALTVEALRDLRAEKDAQISELRAENERLREQLTTRTEELARRLQALEGEGHTGARRAR